VGEGASIHESITMLKATLSKHGPCMLAMNGHARMLDNIEFNERYIVLSIRDPFTGSVLSVRNHEGFWAVANARLDGSVPVDTASKRHWDAIFLRR
jgi:hypothetical protein